MTTKINLTALAEKTRSLAPKIALVALAATAASVAIVAFNKANDDESVIADIVESVDEF